MTAEKKTRAIVPPPRSSSTFLPKEMGVLVGPANNMRDERLAPMTFNMPRNWHTRFKATAVLRGMNMKDLLIECFEAWERENSDPKR